MAGEKFQAHKLEFAARSPVFRYKFFEKLEEGKQAIVVEDVGPKVFEAMLHFISGDTLVDDAERVPSSSSCESPISDFLIAKLLAVAHKYGLARLKQLCQSCLCKDISVS